MSSNGDTDTRPGLFADLCASIDVQVGSIDRLAEEVKKSLKRSAMAPVFGRSTGTVVIPANGVGIVRFNNAGPDQGHLWFVRSITVGGLSPTVTAAGRADVFVSASDLRSNTSLAQLGLAEWRDQAAALPLVAFYGRGSLPLRMNEELYVVFSNATSTQTYVAAVQYEDFDETALMRQEFAL